jgi:hypothetical protein
MNHCICLIYILIRHLILIAGEHKRNGSGNNDSLVGMRGDDKWADWTESINTKFGTQYSVQQVKGKAQTMQRVAKEFLNKNRGTHYKKAYQVTGASTAAILREHPLLTQSPAEQAERAGWLDHYLKVFDGDPTLVMESPASAGLQPILQRQSGRQPVPNSKYLNPNVVPNVVRKAPSRPRAPATAVSLPPAPAPPYDLDAGHLQGLNTQSVEHLPGLGLSLAPAIQQTAALAPAVPQLQMAHEASPLVPLNFDHHLLDNSQSNQQEPLVANTAQISQPRNDVRTSKSEQMPTSNNNSNGSIFFKRRSKTENGDEDEEQSPDRSRRRISNGRAGGRRNATTLHGRGVSQDLAAVMRNANNKDESKTGTMNRMVGHFAEGTQLRKEWLHQKKLEGARKEVKDLSTTINACRKTMNALSTQVMALVPLMANNPPEIIKTLYDKSTGEFEKVTQQIERDEAALVKAQEKLQALEGQQQEQPSTAGLQGQQQPGSGGTAVDEAVAEGEAAGDDTDDIDIHIEAAAWAAPLARLNNSTNNIN